MKKYIVITADTNDGDYVSEKTPIGDEDLAVIQPVIDAIKEYTETDHGKQVWNWWAVDSSRQDNPTPKELYLDSGKCTEEAFDVFNSFVPYFEGGVHTIVSIEVLEVTNEYSLL
jgi:hypothetical protein